MKFTRNIELKFEKNETLVVRYRRKNASVRCDACGREVRMLDPEDAAVVAKTDMRRIYSEIEAGRIHFIESPEGLLVCLDSLLSDRVPNG